MKRFSLFVTLSLILIILSGCQMEVEPQTILTHQTSLEAQTPSMLGGNINTQWEAERLHATKIQPSRYEQEERILAATVRIQMDSWTEFDLGMGREPLSNESISHGTIISGRHVVTHNHFKYAQTDNTSLYATLYQTDGTLLVAATTFTVAFADSQTLILEFRDKNGNDLFQSLGLRSVEILPWESLPLTTMTEVAQVDWDGVRTSVNWVEIRAILMDETPRLELGHYLQQGASGGGIFWNGSHIGNNWNRVEVLSENKQMVDSYSESALNSSKMMGLVMAANNGR